MKLESFKDISIAFETAMSAGSLLIEEEDIGVQFFDLKTGFLGELFQKFSNYHLKLALIVVDPLQYGKHFSELAYEHKNHPLIRFYPYRSEAFNWIVI